MLLLPPNCGCAVCWPKVNVAFSPDDDDKAATPAALPVLVVSVNVTLAFFFKSTISACEDEDVDVAPTRNAERNDGMGFVTRAA